MLDTDNDILEMGFMLEEKGLTDLEIDNFFAHHGVRGQKWGIRRQRRIDLLKRAGKKGNALAKTRAIVGFGPHLGPIDFVKGRGLTGGFKRKAARMQARENRIKSGKATVGDQLHRFGGARLTDVIPVRKKNVHNRKVGTAKRDALAIAGVGAVFTVAALARFGASAASASNL